MNTFPPETRTPPLPVIAFIGCPELHKDVGSFFNHTIRPPFFSVGLAEPSESLLVRLFGVKRQQKPFSTPDGILKADWFAKQRQRRAAVAVAFVPRSHVEGDPSSWMRMLSGLRAIRAASSHKGVTLLVVVVQDGQVTELPADRVAGLTSNLDLQQRHLCVISRQCFDPALTQEAHRQLQDAQLVPLGQLVTEAAAAYYQAAAARLRQKQLDVTAALGSCPPEMNAATAFKLAVLAEFRQDWLAAVSSYQAAAAALQGVPLGRPTVSCQRHAEVVAVAEVVHFKAMMLLLHQQRYPEAIQQLRGHLAAFGPLPEGLPLAAAAAHYGWLARQYQCAAEMVGMARIDEATLQVHKDVSACYLLMSAAQLAVSRKAAAQQLASQRGGAATPFDAAAVRKGRYLGQVELKQPEGAPPGHSDLTDAQFCLYLECEERRLNHSQLVLDLLLQAQAAHMKQTSSSTDAAAAAAAGPPAAVSWGARGAADRLQARLAWLIAEQHIDTHNRTAARKLLMQAVHTYRRDGWDTLLLYTLLLLRDVCQRLKLHKEALLHSLELSCLMADSLAQQSGSTGSTVGPAASAQPPGQHALVDQQQASALAAAALAGMLKGPTDKRSSIMKAGSGSSSPNSSPRLADGQTATAAALGSAGQQQAGGSPVVAGRPGGSAGSSSMLWSYVVQQLDIAAALQRLSAREDGTRANAFTDLLLQFHQQDFGWWRVLTLSGGFVAAPPDPGQLQVCMALCSNLPVPLPLAGASLTLTDNKGSWTVPVAVGPGQNAQQLVQLQQHSTADAELKKASVEEAAGIADGLESLQLTDVQHSRVADKAAAAAGWPVALQAGQWQQLNVRFPPRCVGTVYVEQLQLQLSAHCSVNFLLSSFPPGLPALGHSTLPSGVMPFSQRQGVKLGSWAAKVQHVGQLPRMTVLLPELLLVGEFVPVEVAITVTAAQPATALELILRTAMGATPGQAVVLAALPDGKLHALNPECHTLQLPALPASGCFTQRLWVRSQVPSSLTLAAVLSCPATLSQEVDLQFVEPFEHVTRLNGEMGVHALVAPSRLYAAADGTAACTAADAAVAAGGGVPVVVGQVLYAQVLVRGLNDVDLQLLDAQLELQQGSGLQLLNKLSDQLACRPLAASLGSVHCLLLQLVPTAKSSDPVSMGRLQLKWKRRHEATAVASSGNAGGTATSAATAAAAAAGNGLVIGAAPPDEVTTSLDLPHVVVQDSLLSVRVMAPDRATAGIAFSFTLQVYNPTSKPQELTVSVQEAQSFVFAGNKHQVLTILPNDKQSLTWTLVAHGSGQLPLPAVRVASARFSCHVVTQSTHIHVMPF